MLLLLLAIPAAVFAITLAVMGGLGWAVVVSAAVLAGGAVLGSSTDID